MKINETTRIIGNRVILVPYCRHHVPKYHDWMSLVEIQELTSSEPLTLDEEYEMQEKWQKDEDKLTFIVLRRDLYEAYSGENDQEREVNAMVGDVNCFIIEEGEEEDVIGDSSHKQAELEVMIVEKANRGSGYGSEAVFLMINYCCQYLKFQNFLVKIGEENSTSVKMFEKLGFVYFKYIKPFKQVCLKLSFDENMVIKESDGRESAVSDKNRYKFQKDFKLNIVKF